MRAQDIKDHFFRDHADMARVRDELLRARMSVLL
jgi:hypothetical protein